MQSGTSGVVDVGVAVLPRVQGVFAVASLMGLMAAFGLQLTRGDVYRTVREYNLVARWLLSNLLVVPLFAVLFGAVFRLPDPILLGLVLVAVAPGAPFVPQLVALAGEDTHEAVRLTAALTVVAAVTVPVFVAGVLFVFRIDVGFSASQLLVALLAIVVAPLVAGAVVRERRPELARRLRRPLTAVANGALFVALAATVLYDPGGVLRVLRRLFATGALLVMTLFVLASIALGWLAGGPTRQSRRIHALGTAGRNVNVALFVAVTTAPESTVDDSIVAFTTLMFAVSALVAWYWGRGRRAAKGTVPEVGSGES